MAAGARVQAPAGLLRLFQHPRFDWNLRARYRGQTDAPAYLARGKLLGGSSSTNATLYHRGTAADYDSWGIDAWRAQDVLPWFCAAEDNPAFGNTDYHRTGACLEPLLRLGIRRLSHLPCT